MGFDTMNSLEVQALLKISRSTLEAWLKSGKLKGYKVGRRWLFRRAEVEALIGDHPHANAVDQLRVLEECRELQKEILKSRRGKPLPSLTTLIHETREERPGG